MNDDSPPSDPRLLETGKPAPVARDRSKRGDEAPTHGRAPETRPSSGTRPPRRRRRLRLALLLLGPLLLLAGAAYVYVTGARYVSTDDAYVKADIAAISAEVSGRVVEVRVVNNEPVEAGAVLFRLDDRPFRLALAQDEARLKNARDEILALEASYRQKGVEIELARQNIAYYQRELAIYEKMRQARTVAQTQLDDARHDLTVALQKLPALQQAQAGILAQLGGTPGLPPEQHARYLAAKAVRDQAALDLQHAVIRAPADGIVSNVTLRPGDYVRTGTPVFSLVETGHLWVQANFKETELTHVRPDQPATIRIDTYPGVTWDVTVTSISPASAAEFALLPPQNSTGNWVKVVQRIPVRLDVESRSGRPPLRAGMSAIVDIDTGYERPLPGLIQSALAWAGMRQ